MPSNCTSRSIFKKMITGYWKDVWTHMFITALLTVAKIKKHPHCPSADEWIKKTWRIHRMDYYLAMKRYKVPACATVWITSKTHAPWQKPDLKEHLLCYLLVWNVQNRSNQRDREQVRGCLGLGVGVGVGANGSEVSLAGGTTFWNEIVVIA